MSDETVAHRFIQVHQACEQEGVWALLESKSTSTMAISHACEKLYNRVFQNQLDFVTAIQNLQNLVLTCDDQVKSTVFIQTIARLIMNHEKCTRHIEFTIIKQSTKSNTAPIVHPFVVIMKQKPSLYNSLLDEVDYLLTFFDHEKVLSVLSRFIEAVFLTENQVQFSALINRFTMTINEEVNVNILFQLLIHFLHKYPLRKEDQRFFSLLDMLIWLNKMYSCTNAHYLYTLVDRLLTTVEAGESIIPHLVRLDRILSTSEYSFDIIWTSISFALLKVQTVEEQQFIVDMMNGLDKESANNMILRVAYLPLYQALAELNDKHASKEIVGLKKNVLALISFIDNEGKSYESYEKFAPELTDYTYGILGRLLCHLEEAYSGKLEDSSDSTLALLFTTPFVFSNDQVACASYSRIAQLTCIIQPSYKFPALLFFLRGLRVSSGNPLLVTHLLKDVIPSLVDVNDPVITSKVLQVVLTSIGGNDSVMSSLGVKALGRTFELQPRVWQELKKVFAEWVLRRKSGTVRRKIDLAKTGPIKMELAILTTMRDVCKSKPRECAPDILPMVISLLQTCQDLSMASLSIMVDIVTSCVENGLVESRSIWNICVVYLAQFALGQDVGKSLLLTKQLCRFYSVAGMKNDVSEPYLQFKESLLKEFISPLLESDHDEAISHALIALSKFPAQDITIILPEKAMDYIVQCKLNKNQHKVLATLMSNELDHMRRGLFKEEAKQQKVEQVTKQEQNTNEAGEVVGQREKEMELSFTQSWEDVRVAPGLRSGYANAMLHILDNEKIHVAESTMEAIGKTKWYRHMITLFTDVSLTDHLLIRVSSIQSWEVFFKHALKGSENDMEAIVQLVLKDLLARLERSTVPGVTCNTILAMTGLVSTVRLFIPSFAASCANDITDVLMKNYIVLSSSPLSNSIHLMSEEVQFAARFALGHLSVFIISNENLVSTLYNVLMDSAISSNNKSRNIDTAVDLVQFANGYAAGHFVASLAMWPTMTDSVESLKNEGMSKLISYCRDQVASDSRVLGIMMGLASRLKSNSMGEELSFAVGNLQDYLANKSVKKGLLLGSTWLAAAGALKEEGIDFEISGMIEAVMAAASSDIDSAQHFYNFSVPYAQVQLQHYLYSEDGEQSETMYWNAFEPLLDSIQNDDASSHYRIASLFSMGSLLGVNYLCTDDRTYIEAEKYRPAVRQRALDKLAFVAGLNSKSAPVGNLKSGRISAAICGKVIESANNMVHALNASTDPHQDDMAEKSSLLSASSEPMSYSRLNSNTSYIRAIFDRLVIIASDASQVETISMFLQGLIETPGPLPPVNWFSLVSKISKLSSSAHVLCLDFAATHATSSLSLSEFLLTQMTSILGSVDPSHVVLNYIGMVLELAGLPRLETREEKKRRGMSAVIKRITISESRALEIIQLVGQKFHHFDYDTQYTLLSNLEKHLPTKVDESKVKFVSSIRDILMQHITLYMFEHVDILNSGYEGVVRKATACSVTGISQISPVNWDTVTPEGRIISLVEFYRLHSSEKQTIVKHLSAAIVHLIGMDSTRAEIMSCWNVIAEAIAHDNDDFGWLIRVLDAYVVFIGASTHVDHDKISSSIEHSLAAILTALNIGSSVQMSDETQNLDTAYSIGTLVLEADGQKNEQEQIVRRLFKLYDMTQEFSVASLFDHIVRALPSDIVVQNETKYRYD